MTWFSLNKVPDEGRNSEVKGRNELRNVAWHAE